MGNSRRAAAANSHRYGDRDYYPMDFNHHQVQPHLSNQVCTHANILSQEIYPEQTSEGARTLETNPLQVELPFDATQPTVISEAQEADPNQVDDDDPPPPYPGPPSTGANRFLNNAHSSFNSSHNGEDNGEFYFDRI